MTLLECGMESGTVQTVLFASQAEAGTIIWEMRQATCAPRFKRAQNRVVLPRGGTGPGGPFPTDVPRQPVVIESATVVTGK